MIEYRYEYRINKGACECFRADSIDKTREKLAELKASRPNKPYSMQARSVRLDRYGVALRDCYGRPQWGPWS